MMRKQGKAGNRFAPSSWTGDATQSRGRRPPPWESPNCFIRLVSLGVVANDGSARSKNALNGNADCGPETAERAVRERNLAAVRTGDVSCYRKAQTRPALILVARFVQPIEGPEHILAMRGRYARAVIVDDDRHELRLADRRNANALGMAQGVGDE